MRRLPPLNALRAFESVARLGGIRAAQKELHVTQSAISHQIAKLEEYLKNSLFHRKGNKMHLTDVGRDYLTKIEPALNMVSQATTDASTMTNHETLTISLPPSLLFNWLLPRLKNFTKENEGINIRFVQQLTLKAGDEIDCAIEYRYQPNTECVSTLFLSDQVVPMCSPDYMKEKRIQSVEDLERCVLIETHRRLVSWQSIFAAIDQPLTQNIITVDYTLHALQTAKHGLGVAIANLYNAKKMIDSGELVIPFHFDEGSIPMSPRYYVSTLKSKDKLPRIKQFKAWLYAELKQGD